MATLTSRLPPLVTGPALVPLDQLSFGEVTKRIIDLFEEGDKSIPAKVAARNLHDFLSLVDFAHDIRAVTKDIPKTLDDSSLSKVQVLLLLWLRLYFQADTTEKMMQSILLKEGLMMFFLW